MGYKILFSLIISVAVIGCNTVPKDALKLSPTSLQDRQLQTRQFKTKNDVELISAGIGVLQDMGYTIDETEKDVGLVTASKVADATDGGQVFLAILAAAFGGQSTAIDKDQKIKVCLVTKKSNKDPSYFLTRITFQRVIWNTRGQVSRAETIKNKDIYNEFFAKLSKSVFLEANKI